MPETIRTILEELYQLAPELKKQEAELAPLVLKLIKAKPDISPSPEFVSALKLKLTLKEKELMSSNRVNENNTMAAWLKLASFMRQPFMLTGVAVIIFAFILVFSLPGTIRRLNQADHFDLGIARLPGGAFGSLLALSDSAPVGLGSGKMASPEAGDASAIMPPTAPGPAGLGGGAGMDRAMIYPYPYPESSYTFVGEPIVDLPAQVDVLRRIKNVGLPVNQSFLKSFDVGSLQLDSFAGASLSQITLAEDKEFGYIVSIDFLEGMVNVYENWRRWPQPFNDCRDEDCYRRLQIKPAQVPADESLITAASAWLRLRGISTSAYGTPFVQNEWRLYYEQAEDKATAYVPDIITVIYPAKVNNFSVYEYGGNQMGLGVNINVRYNRVSGMWNMSSQRYQASAYETETDWDTLVKYATSGMQGFPIPLAYSESGSTSEAQMVEFTLSTPTIGYFRYWNYQNGDNQELLLPALVFPVQSATESYVFMPRNIVVPMVKEFLQSSLPGDGPIRIMPASPAGGPAVDMPVSSGGSAGVAEPAPAIMPSVESQLNPYDIK